MRESTENVLKADYIRTARAKGGSPLRVMSVHAAPNASLPIMAFLGPAAAGILTGSFVVEKLFAIPGMGNVFVNACLNKDIPLVLGITMVYTVILIVMNMLADIACAMADPRVAINA
jgi:ABC-type dipeptide/oligopeptide/nickel transport system permease component